MTVEQGFNAAVAALRVYGSNGLSEETNSILHAAAKDLERNRATILAALPPPPAGDWWLPMGDINDVPDHDVFHALLWGRLHVECGDRTWWTEWKVLKAAWVYWTGSGVRGSAKFAGNWYHPSEQPCRVTNIEATHWQPLPEPPAMLSAAPPGQEG